MGVQRPDLRVDVSLEIVRIAGGDVEIREVAVLEFWAITVGLGRESDGVKRGLHPPAGDRSGERDARLDPPVGLGVSTDDVKISVRIAVTVHCWFRRGLHPEWIRYPIRDSLHTRW